MNANELAIEVRGLTHRYERSAGFAVEALDFEVRRGEIVGLLGPNGAGKTTTLHTVLGLLAPTAGVVRVFGRSPLLERMQVLGRINFASVDVHLPSNLLVEECLYIFSNLYGVSYRSERIRNLVERFDLKALRRQRVGSLSSGEHMRLKICKALLNSPELLILDEPTLSLDPYMAHRVRSLLKEIQSERQISILHTSHNMREVESFCDRILFLHHGRKIAEGPPSEVLARSKSRNLDELFIRVAVSGDIFDAG
ncbi:MAG: ABC transporter ATP-binding protein [Candidatus Omnitrophica bacterium]|nr:ABC transporter ATP-binding protein [Candidatus Omnitrophota bacterium]MBI2174414.1 ABC transporter ATP-binding protein [Candidatus Omnitrophota bacterium]MBI3010682.1 ABC transporter ATP-binding protein [Candidatus Omnitrophota bacterium]